MVNLAITADDFTGALDTAVQFSRNSIHTAVMFYNDLDFSEIDEEVRVVVVDTESRHITGAEAAERVKTVTARAKDAGVTHFYKKTDSVLRGNIGSELLAIMEAAGSQDIMFVPAYPETGRTTAGGCQYLNGLPLDETPFAEDPIDPVTDSSITNIIKSQADASVVVVGRNEAYRPVSDKTGRTVYVFDAVDNKDLKNIAELLKSKDKLWLTAGCAGFAGMLPEVLGLDGPAENVKTSSAPPVIVSDGPKPGISVTGMKALITDSPAFPVSGKKRKMLTVCGSVNEISLRQVDFAVKNGFLRVVPEPYQLLTPDYFDSEPGRDYINNTARCINDGNDVIIAAAENREDREGLGRLAREMKLDEREVPGIISRRLACLVRKIADKAGLEILTIVGGDTAFAVAGSMGFRTVVPRYDIETGVVLSEAIGYGAGIRLITKSGGFGKEDVLVKVRDYVEKMY